MVVGQENVGKTTVINHLQNKKKVPKGGVSMSTDGIDICEWEMKINVKDQHQRTKQIPLIFSIWDFAGQGLNKKQSKEECVNKISFLNTLFYKNYL